MPVAFTLIADTTPTVVIPDTRRFPVKTPLRAVNSSKTKSSLTYKSPPT